MTKGNKEIRFRASDEIHNIVETIQDQLQSAEKTAGAKLLIILGNNKIKDVVDYIDSVSAPLSNKQFEDFFLSLKIRVKQKRDERKQIKAIKY